MPLLTPSSSASNPNGRRIWIDLGDETEIGLRRRLDGLAGLRDATITFDAVDEAPLRLQQLTHLIRACFVSFQKVNIRLISRPISELAPLRDWLRSSFKSVKAYSLAPLMRSDLSQMFGGEDVDSTPC